jgi:transposase
VGIERFPVEIKCLISAKGISVMGAATIMADIVEIVRFKNAKHLTSYLKAAPRVDSSNKTTHIGHLSKRGRKASFRVLLQAVNHLIDWNPVLRAYNERMTGKSRNKVRAAIVGKTITTLYYLLKHKEASRYVDEKNYQLKLGTLMRYIYSKAA